jgi:hypothetical protein
MGSKCASETWEGSGHNGIYKAKNIGDSNTLFPIL